MSSGRPGWCDREIPRRGPPETRFGGPMRSVGIAYGLWALCVLGVAGIHRFYAGRYISGVIWLFTWGLLGIGLLVDLFLIPGMIEKKNRELWAARSWQSA